MTEELDQMMDDYVKELEQEKIEEITSKVLPESLVEEFSQFVQNGSNSPADSYASTLHRESFSSHENFLHFTAILYKLSKDWPPVLVKPQKRGISSIFKSRYKAFSPSRSELFAAALRLEYRDAAEMFQTLSPKVQFAVYPVLQMNSSSSTYALIRMLHKMELDLSVFYTRYHRNAAKFLVALTEASKESSISADLDLSAPSKEFVVRMFQNNAANEITYQLKTNTLNLFGNLHVSIVMLFRTYYGEKVVMDAIERLDTLNEEFCADEVMDILDDWENLKDYPVDWILESR